MNEQGWLRMEKINTIAKGELERDLSGDNLVPKLSLFWERERRDSLETWLVWRYTL